MDLTEKYGHFFDADTQAEGLKLFKSGKVTIYESCPTHVYAEVDGKPFCESKLSIIGNELLMECECNSHMPKQGCKHIWALICACHAFGDLPKATKRSVKKQPIVQSNSEIKDDLPITKLQRTNNDEQVIQFTEPSFQNTGERVQNVAPNMTLNKESIDLEIKKMESHFQHLLNTAKINEDAPNYEINYIINIRESSEGKFIYLQTYWRQQRSDGNWSQPTELMFSPEDDYPTELDYAVMNTIKTTYQKPQPSVIPSAKPIVNMFKIPAAMAYVILPKIAQKLRLFWRSSQDSEEYNILNMLPQPYKFSIEIEESQDHNYTVKGILTSNNSLKDIAESILVSPANFFITTSTIGLCDYSDAFELAQKLCYERTIQLNSWKANEFVQELITTTSLSTDLFPPRLKYTLSEPQITPCLYFKTAQFKYKNSEQLHVELSFDYNGTKISAQSQQERVISNVSQNYFKRNINFEEYAKETLKSLDFRFNTNPNLEELGWKLHPAKLDKTVRILLDQNWHITAHGKSYIKPKTKDITVSSNLDWFELKASVDFGDEEVSLPELMAARKKGESHIILGDGSFGVLPLDWLKNFTVLTEIGLTEDQLLKFNRSQSFILNALLSKQNITIHDTQLLELNEKINKATAVYPMNPPPSFVGELRPYQQEGLGWMLYLQKLGLGGCLADDMGLGKTVQVLALLEHRRLAETGKPSLIVLPKSLIFNWQQETAKFAPQMKTLIHTGPKRDKFGNSFSKVDIVFTTYGTLKRDITTLQTVQFDYCILDESQAIKNADTDAAKAVRLVQAKHRLTMTGTPIENHVGELLSQLEFLNPGMFGNSKLIKMFSSGTSKLTNDDFLAINKAIKPFILRRTKKEVAKELPEKVEQVLYCELDAWQRDKYEELKKYYRKELLDQNDGESNQIQILEALLRLRQACCHPALINEKYLLAPSAKLELIITKVQELISEKHKVLMFSQFTSFLKIIQEQLKHDNIKFSYLDGETKDRAKEVERFQEDTSVEVFLISLKAGGTGLNLTAADYVFLLDPWWNPAIEAQAIDRAYRIGQKKNVFAYKIIAKDTVEEKVLQMQRNKKEIADQIINQDSNKAHTISRSDLDFLLK